MSTVTTPTTPLQPATLRQGRLRTLTLQVPDTRRPGFAAACRRQSRSLHDSAEHEDTAWIEAAQADILDDEPW